MVWRKADAAMRRVLNTTLPNSFLSSLPDDARNLEVCVVWQHLERYHDPILAAEPSAERKESEVREGPRKGDDGGDDDFTAEKVEIALNKLFGDKSKKAIIGQSEASLVTRINHVKKGTKKRKLDANANVQGQGCFNCHQKAQCECMKADRDPSREGGGGVFRTNIQAQPSKKSLSSTMEVATIQHVAKKQQMAHEPPTDVEVEDEFKMSETEKSNWESDQDGF
ncbi:hypothetical protein PC112_g10486 [Phytophthora cactorum]|nr:hypothetical protein PC112_g10486 [Phytophthora cactorum]